MTYGLRVVATNKTQKVTTVVNYINIGREQSYPIPSDWDDAELRSVQGPIYEKSEVLEILKAGILHTRLATKDAMTDAANAGFSLKEVITLLISALKNGNYKNSQWCRQGNNADTVPCALCDAYTVSVMSSNNRKIQKYYVKFAISKPGTLLLIFSCHE